MNEYLGDLMMGVLIASTAFCGLTGVVIGQIRERESEIARRKAMVGFLSASFFFGVIAILFTIMWFSAPSTEISWLSPTVISPWALFAQIVLFVSVIVDFWLSE